LARPTSENESTSWPTPSVHGNHNAPGAGEKSGTGLSTAVKQWPTPSVANASGGQTSRGGDRKGELLLSGMVRMYPTPRASEYKDCGPVGSKSQKHMDDRFYLCAAVKDPKRDDAMLNPDWVCWLMGVPIGWVSLYGTSNEILSWENEPDIPRVTTESEDRIDEVRMLGNGVVPQTAARAWDVLSAQLDLEITL